MAVSTEELRKSIQAILKGADLTALSSKQVREKLENQYKTNFADRRQEIDDIVMDMIADDRKKDKSFENGTSDATESEKSESEPSSASTDDEDYKPVPTKRGKAASSKPAAAKPAAKKPRKKKAESSASDSDEEEPEKEKEKKKPPPKKAAAGGGGGAGGAKKSSTYSRKCILSPELAEVVGAPEMARHDVVKKMWEIVKGRNLYDPSNKQFAICDDQLYKVFGVKRFRTFGMMKYLKTHIKDPAK